MLIKRSRIQQTQNPTQWQEEAPGYRARGAWSALRRPFAIGSALLLGAFSGVVVADTAHAGPDQDRVTVTRQHVDAPVPAWDSTSKTLSIQVNHDPADIRVLWLGRGWAGSTSYPIVKHLFSVPDDPQLAFLGESGTTWLSAPQDPGPGNTPIWAGIGVDGSLSGASSQFEAHNYVLDLVSVNGPGRMEMFRRTTWGVRRSWSSHDLAYRTIFNPRHMHTFTTFSKPGRYEVNVAAVARDANGKKVYTSRVTPVVWQVGGTRPDQGSVKDVRVAFAQAPTQRADGLSTSPQFTMAPKTNFQVAGDDFLTDFTFSTGNDTDNGHLIVTIDGFYMNEVPVTNGVATFDEMIGDSASTFQAIYIPTDSAGARWASQPLEFSRLHGQAVTVTEGTDVLVAEQARELSPTLTAQAQQVTSGAMELAIAPLTDSDEYSVALRGDTHLNATYKIGFFRDKSASIADCSAEGTLVNGQAVFTGDFNYCKDHPVIQISVLPHPYANVAPMTRTVDNPGLSTARAYSLNLAVRADNSYELVGPADSQQPPTPPTVPGTPAPQPQPHPQLPPIVEQPPTVQTLHRDPIEVGKGHLDIRLVPAANGSITMAIKDDSLTREKKSVLREPSAVTLLVPRSALMRRSEQLNAPTFDFLGPVGTQNYVLPETQVDSLVWPGFSTEGIDYSAYPQGIDYEVTLSKGPANGVVSFVTTSGLGNEVNVRVRTNDPALKWIRTTESTHLHGAWIFSQPGVYHLAVRAVSAGKEIAPPATVTFAVDRGAEALPPLKTPQPPTGDQPDTPNSPPPASQPDNSTREPHKEPDKKGNSTPTPQPDVQRDLDRLKGLGTPDSSTPPKAQPGDGQQHDTGTQKDAGSTTPSSKPTDTATRSSQQGNSGQKPPSGQTDSSLNAGAQNAPQQSASASTSRQRTGRVVDISRPTGSRETAQSGRTSQADTSQSADRHQSGARTTVIRAQGKSQTQSSDHVQSSSEDAAQSLPMAATSPSILGGYSPVTVGIILIAAIAAGAITVVAVRKSLMS